jgi:hypothetical protein
VQAVVARTLVQLRDEVAGGGEHDRVESAVAVGLPRGEQLLGCRGWVADMDPLTIKVEAERFGSAVAQRKRGSGLCWVLEPV